MDWQPSQETTVTSFNPPPAVHRSPSPPSSQGAANTNANAFWYRVPAAPIAPAARLRAQQPIQPVFHKTTPEKQQNFFNRVTKRSESGTLGDEDLNEEESQSKKMGGGRTEVAMAQPRFFPQATDTGLESLFNSAFSLSEEPPEVVSVQSQQRQREKPSMSMPTSQSLLLVLGLLAWELHTVFFRCIAMAIVFTIATINLFLARTPTVVADQALRRQKTATTDRVLYLLEAIAAVTLAASEVYGHPEEFIWENGRGRSNWVNGIGTGLLVGMLGWEVWGTVAVGYRRT
jgi:hypothetical protein